METGRRWAVRGAGFSAATLVLVEALEFIVWPLPVDALSLLAIVTSIAVPVVGAVLVMRNDERGIAVLLFGALAAVPALSAATVRLLWWTEPITAIDLFLACLRVVAPAMLIVGGVAAWRAREPQRWHGRRPAAWLYAGVAAITFFVGQLWPARHVLPPSSVFDLPPLVQLVAVAAALIAVTRIPRRLAGAALLATVGPVLATGLLDLGQALTFGASPRGLGGPLDLIGQLALVAIGVLWSRNPGPDAAMRTDVAGPAERDPTVRDTPTSAASSA